MSSSPPPPQQLSTTSLASPLSASIAATAAAIIMSPPPPSTLSPTSTTQKRKLISKSLSSAEPKEELATDDELPVKSIKSSFPTDIPSSSLTTTNGITVNPNNEKVQPTEQEPSPKTTLVVEVENNQQLLETIPEPDPVDILDRTTDQLRKQICLNKFKQLNAVRLSSVQTLTELYHLQTDNGNYLNYYIKENQQQNEEEKQRKDQFVNKQMPNKDELTRLEKRLKEKFKLGSQTILIENNNSASSSSSSFPLSVVHHASSLLSMKTSEKQKMEQMRSISERAKHENSILARIAQLRRDGLWSVKRLPKLMEPARAKTHWDFLLDEMTWMSTDFEQERRWKKNCSKKLAQAVQRHFRELEQRDEQKAKDEQRRLKKQAQQVARDIMIFWRQAEKLIIYKQQQFTEQKRQHTLDMHLNFIVDQTEKYSTWLVQGLKKKKEEDEEENKQKTVMEDEDEEFIVQNNEEEEEDDESTIEKEEQQEESEEKKNSVEDEIMKLQMESELPLDDLLKDYNVDENYFEKEETSTEEEEEEEESEKENNDEEFEEEESEEDDEETIEEEENLSMIYKIGDQQQTVSNHKSELEMLKADNELSIEELLSKLTQKEEEEESQKEEETSKESSDKVLNTIAAQALLLQPTGYTLETTNVKTRIPTELLKHTLREYQHVGLDWLVTMYENKLNGILADEMGLGKTIQTIALLAYLAYEKSVWGPHLIVVPTSVMLNWELEFKKWCPGFKILTYFGNPKERKLKRQGWTKANAFHVCITSYKLVIQDHSAFRRKKWKYFILDEAQNIKNFRSQRWQALLNFQSQRRLLLTGTPLQNNLMELWSLMHFLMPHVFSSHREFNQWFSQPLRFMIEGQREYNEQLIRRLHKVLRPFILRRLKADVEKQMPKKYEHVVVCRLSKRQRLLYDEFMSLSSTKSTLNEGNYMSCINILMQLRKVCNHPDLFEPRPIVSPFVVADSVQLPVPSLVFNLNLKKSILSNYSSMEMSQSAFACHRAKRLQVSRELIDQKMRKQEEEKEDDLINSEDTKKFFPFDNFRGLLFNFEEKKKEEESMEEDDDDDEYCSSKRSIQFVKSLLRRDRTIENKNQKKKGDLIFNSNSVRCNEKPIYGVDLRQLLCVGNDLLSNDNESSFLTKSHSQCQKTLNYEKLRHKLKEVYWRQTSFLYQLLHLIDTKLYKRGENHEFVDILRRFVIYVPSVCFYVNNSNCNQILDCQGIHLRVTHPEPSEYQKAKTLIQDITHLYYNNEQLTISNDSLSIEMLQFKNQLYSQVSTMQRVQMPEKRLIQYDCGKLQRLDELLRDLYADQHRVLLFTQMTRMLDILENFLNYHGYKYLRLDGTTTIQRRQQLMERFNQDKRMFVFILSTRSGGIGVNLTGADTVIFYDSDWNPTMDAQAQDRCHRIGQTRDVHIYRLISQSTVEENILKKARQKRLLNDLTIEEGQFTTGSLLDCCSTKQNITELFKAPTGFNEGEEENVVKKQKQQNETIPVSEEIQENPPAAVVDQAQFEAALALVEDESDVQAAKELKAEVRADIAEFDENEQSATVATATSGNMECDENQQNVSADIEMNKVEHEFKLIETELKPIERYALKFLESFGNISLSVTNEEKEMEIERVKQEWELNSLKRLKEEEERKAEQDEDEVMLTYAKTEVDNRNNNNTKKKKKKKGKFLSKKREQIKNKNSTTTSSGGKEKKFKLSSSKLNKINNNQIIRPNPTHSINTRKKFLRTNTLISNNLSEMNETMTTNNNNNNIEIIINEEVVNVNLNNVENELPNSKIKEEKEEVGELDEEENKKKEEDNVVITAKEKDYLHKSNFESNILLQLAKKLDKKIALKKKTDKIELITDQDLSKKKKRAKKKKRMLNIAEETLEATSAIDNNNKVEKKKKIKGLKIKKEKKSVVKPPKVFKQKKTISALTAEMESGVIPSVITTETTIPKQDQKIKVKRPRKPKLMQQHSLSDSNLLNNSNNTISSSLIQTSPSFITPLNYVNYYNSQQQSMNLIQSSNIKSNIMSTPPSPQIMYTGTTNSPSPTTVQINPLIIKQQQQYRMQQQQQMPGLRTTSKLTSPLTIAAMTAEHMQKKPSTITLTSAMPKPPTIRTIWTGQQNQQQPQTKTITVINKPTLSTFNINSPPINNMNIMNLPNRTPSLIQQQQAQLPFSFSSSLMLPMNKPTIKNQLLFTSATTNASFLNQSDNKVILRTTPIGQTTTATTSSFPSSSNNSESYSQFVVANNQNQSHINNQQQSLNFSSSKIRNINYISNPSSTTTVTTTAVPISLTTLATTSSGTSSNSFLSQPKIIQLNNSLNQNKK